jgi:hypothetical protein
MVVFTVSSTMVFIATSERDSLRDHDSSATGMRIRTLSIRTPMHIHTHRPTPIHD